MQLNTSPQLVEAVKSLARGDYTPGTTERRETWESSPRWRELRQLGSRLWLDTGDIDGAAQRWTSEFEALTTNNTLLNREVQKGIYDDLIGQLLDSSGAIRDLDEHQRIIEVALILNARHGLRLVERFDALVSVELHTDLADDLEATEWYARRLFTIHPERFIVKVPLTPAGYLAARKLSSSGVKVNFTLGFSARQNYLVGLVAEPDFVNVFLGRLNSFVIDNGLGDGENVGERTLTASQDAVSELRREHGVRTQQIAASMREGHQVNALAGADVMTLPLSVADGFLSASLGDEGLVPYQQQTYPVSVSEPAAVDVIANLWKVTPTFKKIALALTEEPLEDYEADDLRAFCAARGAGGLFPVWTDEDSNTIVQDGKIPVYDRWADRLQNGSVDLDALMSQSGLKSFATDQDALDNRIKTHLS